MANSRWIIGIVCCAAGVGYANGSSIPVTNLQGNNLIFANYLNQNAPASTIALFSSFQGKELTDALESAAPTRNAHTLFMATTGLFSSSQLLTDHLQQQRIRHHAKEGSPLSYLHEPDSSLLVADASDGVPVAETVSDATGAPALDEANISDKSGAYYKAPAPEASPALDATAEPCVDLGDYALWAEAIGACTSVKKMQQTPSFYAGTGGLVAGVDYSKGENASFGSGVAYLYSGLRERQDGGAPTVNQVMAFIYKETVRSNFYADVSIWGGYYMLNNRRHILFPNMNETALSHAHGWQCLPHLELGGKWHGSYTDVESFAMIDWANSWESHFAEHGATGLNMKQKRHYSSMLRCEGGFRFYQSFALSKGTLTLLEKLSYVNKQSFHAGNVPAALIGSSAFLSLETLKVPKSLGLGQFEIIYDPMNKKRPKCAISYQGEFSTLFRSQQIVLTVEKIF